MSNVSHVTDADFEAQVLKSEIPTLVDFWAPWCGPCRFIGPVIEELSEEFDGKMKFVKLNTDENQQTAVNYRIRSIPSLMIFKDGKLAEMQVGALPKEQLVSFINRHL